MAPIIIKPESSRFHLCCFLGKGRKNNGAAFVSFSSFFSPLWRCSLLPTVFLLLYFAMSLSFVSVAADVGLTSEGKAIASVAIRSDGQGDKSPTEGRTTTQNNPLCVQEPFAKSYACERTRQVEKEYPCDTKVEREVCEYVEDTSHGNTCQEIKTETIEYPCYALKTEEVCWKVPKQKSKQCTKTTKKQKAIETQRTIRRERCFEEAYEVPSICYRQEMKSVSYMCYKAPPSICKTEKVPFATKCKQTEKRTQSYRCEKPVFETRCEREMRGHVPRSSSSSLQYQRFSPTFPPVSPQACRQIQVMKEQDCFRQESVEVDKPCTQMKQRTVCQPANDPEPDTCDKELPSLEEYACTTTRHRQKCELADIVEKSVDYVDVTEEESYDCPFVEDEEQCVSYDVVAPSVCKAEIQKVHPVPCRDKLMKEICQVKVVNIPRTCYSLEAVKQKHTCYEVDYKMKCYRSNNPGSSSSANTNTSSPDKTRRPIA